MKSATWKHRTSSAVTFGRDFQEGTASCRSAPWYPSTGPNPIFEPQPPNPRHTQAKADGPPGLSAALLERMDERSRALSKTRKKRQVTTDSVETACRINC